jgi:hypothetical protein
MGRTAGWLSSERMFDGKAALLDKVSHHFCICAARAHEPVPVTLRGSCHRAHVRKGLTPCRRPHCCTQVALAFMLALRGCGVLDRHVALAFHLTPVVGSDVAVHGDSRKYGWRFVVVVMESEGVTRTFTIYQRKGVFRIPG